MTTAHVLGGTALCGLGVAGIAETVLDFARWRRAPGWPVAEGRVLSSYLKQDGAGQEEYTERLKFRYEFHVNGQRYTGTPRIDS